MKTLIYPFLLLALFSCNSANEKTEYFEKRFEKITFTTPVKLTSMFLENCDKNNENAPFKNYTPEMINSQIAAFYRSAIDDHLKLIIDILVYKEILKNKNATIEDLKPIIYKLQDEKMDKLNNIVLQSFDLILDYSNELVSLNDTL